MARWRRGDMVKRRSEARRRRRKDYASRRRTGDARRRLTGETTRRSSKRRRRKGETHPHCTNQVKTQGTQHRRTRRQRGPNEGKQSSSASWTPQRWFQHDSSKSITITANPTKSVWMQLWQVEDEGEGTQCPHFELPNGTTFRTPPTTMFWNQWQYVGTNDDAQNPTMTHRTPMTMCRIQQWHVGLDDDA